MVTGTSMAVPRSWLEVPGRATGYGFVARRSHSACWAAGDRQPEVIGTLRPSAASALAMAARSSGVSEAAAGPPAPGVEPPPMVRSARARARAPPTSTATSTSSPSAT